MSTERSYVDSLRRLVDMYATPLASEGGHGVTLSAEKVEKIFHKVREIWMHHNMFLIALSGRVAQWHAMIKIGDIFEGSVSGGQRLNMNIRSTAFFDFFSLIRKWLPTTIRIL